MKAMTIGLVLAALTLATPAWAGSPDDSSTQVQELKAELNHQLSQPMSTRSPDTFGRLTATQAFLDGQYHRAARRFRFAARFGDKASQLSLGLMHLNGNGVEKNPATAWAWLALAATNGDPSYVATRDRTWSELTSAQRTQAEEKLAGLQPQYNDRATQRRLRAAALGSEYNWNVSSSSVYHMAQPGRITMAAPAPQKPGNR